MKKQLPGWAVLLIITLIAGIALGATYALTKDPIAEQARIQAENARKAALPQADSFEELTLGEDAAVDWAYAGLKDGQPVGYVAQKTVNGFGGEVEVIAGVNTLDADALTLGGITVGGSNFSETAGLGARSRDQAFTDQFIGKSVPVKYVKAGEEKGDNTIDALTSATITTTAVVNGVNDIVKYVKGDILGIAGIEMPARPGDESVFSASAQGFRGPVYVEAAFLGSEVTYISVGDGSFAEDIGIGAKEPEFMIQFIGKSAPVSLEDVDALAGATITTNAVVTALNDAYALSTGAEVTVPDKPVMPEKPAEGVFSATAQGFRGPVYVEAAFLGSEVTYISVGDGSFAEDIGIGAKEPEFMIQFIGKSAPVSLEDVDALTGATITTNAVVTALNEAYAQTLPTAAPTQAPTAAPTAAPTQAPTAAPTEAPRASVPARLGSGSQATGQTISFFTSVKADVTFDGDTISGLSLSASPAGSDAYQPLEQEEMIRNALVGAVAPIEASQVPGVPAYTAAAVALAVNEAYADRQGCEATPDSSSAATIGSAIVFFTDVKAEARFDGDTLTDLALYARKVGAQGWEPMDQEQAYIEALIGAHLPLSTTSFAVDQPYLDTAVCLAVNQAYARAKEGDQADQAAFGLHVKSGEADSIIFYTRVTADCLFSDDTLGAVKLFQTTVGADRERTALDASGLEEVFLNAALPLNAADYAASGYPGYLVQAVVLAVNEAYEQSLAGQQ